MAAFFVAHQGCDGMKFYVIQDEYVAHLLAVDHRVSYNKNMTRVFIGIVFEVGDFDYFAPLTSHKPFHESITASDVRFFKLHEPNNSDNPLGMIRLCNMIPLVSGTYSLLDMSNIDERYKRLIQKQIRFIASQQDEIRRRAALLYQRVGEGRPADLIADCCSFKNLEGAARSYATKNGLALRTQQAPVRTTVKKVVSRDKRPTLTLAGRISDPGLIAGRAASKDQGNESHI